MRYEVNRRAAREPTNLTLPPGLTAPPVIHTGDQPTHPAPSGGGIEHPLP